MNLPLHPLFYLDVPAGHIALHWFGQASFALKDSSRTIILIDPFFPTHRPGSEYIHPTSPLDETTLPTNYVLVTHDHRDHNCVESQLRLLGANRGVRFVGTKECFRRMKDARVPEHQMIALTAGESTQLGTMHAYAFFAKPPDGCPDHNIPPPDVEHLGYIVEAEGLRIYFSGDPVNCFAKCNSLIGPIRDRRPDLAILTTHPTEGEFPYFDGSAETARLIGAKTAIPAHYECFTKRTYDPTIWAGHFSRTSDPNPILIPYDSTLVYPQKE